MLQNSVVNSGLSYLTVFDNTQEELSGAPGTRVCSAAKFRFVSSSTDCSELTPNTCLGTACSGMGWWMSWEIDPSANTSTITPHNPFLGGVTSAPPGTYLMQLSPNTGNLPFNYCSLFG